MSGNFMQGGVGEVAFSDAVQSEKEAREKGFWTLADKMAFADAYEAKHPAVLIKRDWENEAQHAARRAGRPINHRPAPTMGMDPERAAKELRRVYANIQGLEPTHPEYERLWANATNTAHELEDVCGIPRTAFVKGVQAKKADAPIPPELQEKLNRYVKLSPRKRQESIEEGKNVALLTLIRDNEPLPELQELVVEKLASMAMGAEV